MAKLLYVTCNLKSEELSCSLTVGKEFLKEYIKHNPEDEVQFLNLYRDKIQQIDADVLNGLKKMRCGGNFDSLTQTEQQKIEQISNHADQFISADKYVFVTPMYNLGFPAEFKMYIDAICVAGKTFAYTPTGPIGLLKNKGKKCFHIHSSGGFHYGKDEDHSVPYLKSLMQFLGVDSFEAIVIEGVDAYPDRAQEFKNLAISKAYYAANNF
ncbi:FMN-dependent NADH-azoreductase [Geobacter sp. AOG2]|uniref:FMN-dependent NADH-azoreductase n=1 Tax=Geobacter sp. AOG2 TaxID=1566347 RepID=UPI001CC5D772|nr:NAD(P)H-dependent oxidoreductase [Geobacter sp. AOG2]GFE59628.1 FMN-dependent NADH-azoreductase 2 [Geobacter sp. AOG2]